MHQIFSSGGGTQSACITALICAGKLPKPDLCVIADTGREMPTTWEYWDSIIVPNLVAIGVECIRLVKDEWAYKHQDLWNNKGTQLMPTFTTLTDDGQPGKLPNFCSTYWKADVVDIFVRQKFDCARSGYVKWIGFSVNEARRALRMMAGQEWAKGLIRLPLVHDVMHTRDSAISFVCDVMGWPRPPRSRCWCCPLQTDDEWNEIRSSPVLWALAIALEKQLQEKDPSVFLHPSCVPLEQVVFNNTGELFSHCDSGHCFL